MIDVVYIYYFIIVPLIIIVYRMYEDRKVLMDLKNKVDGIYTYSSDRDDIVRTLIPLADSVCGYKLKENKYSTEWSNSLRSVVNSVESEISNYTGNPDDIFKPDAYTLGLMRTQSELGIKLGRVRQYGSNIQQTFVDIMTNNISLREGEELLKRELDKIDETPDLKEIDEEISYFLEDTYDEWKSYIYTLTDESLEEDMQRTLREFRDSYYPKETHYK